MRRMDLATATHSLQQRVASGSPLGATLKFDCGAAGVVVLDGTAVPGQVDNTDRAADCTVALELATLAELLGGTLDPTVGFMTGRFTVSGDMAVAMKLQRVL
jgi:putative sterol carrier protein